MKQIVCCIKKDFLEIIRNKRPLLFNSHLIIVTIMVLGTTFILPSLLNLLAEKSPELVVDGQQIQLIMEKIFPQTTRENMGIWSSDIIIIFTISISLLCCNLLPNEIRTGRWILVKEAGYSYRIILLSKMIVYGSCTALIVFTGYIFYFMLSRIIITNNYFFTTAFINAIILSLSVFSITTISISVSVIYKNHIMAVITMVVTILAAPDILTIFSFGKWFPTYLLTFVYNSDNNFTELITPSITLIILQFFLYYIAARKIDKIEIVR